jgi:hypothetical protein
LVSIRGCSAFSFLSVFGPLRQKSSTSCAERFTPQVHKFRGRLTFPPILPPETLCLACQGFLDFDLVLVLRGFIADDRRATSISDRRATFTADSLGKTSATSGRSTTTFDDACERAWYLPRFSLPKSARLYSGRSSSRFLGQTQPAHPLLACSSDQEKDL